MGKDNWKLDQFLDLLQTEIEMCNNSETEGNTPANQNKKTMDSTNVNERIRRKI